MMDTAATVSCLAIWTRAGLGMHATLSCRLAVRRPRQAAARLADRLLQHGLHASPGEATLLPESNALAHLTAAWLRADRAASSHLFGIGGTLRSPDIRVERFQALNPKP